MADRVVVMYRGLKVDEGRVEDIFANPQHDYTKSLLSAVQKLGEMQGTSLPEPMRMLGTQDQVLMLIKGTDKPLLTVQKLDHALSGQRRIFCAGLWSMSTLLKMYFLRSTKVRRYLWWANQGVGNQRLGALFCVLLNRFRVRLISRGRIFWRCHWLKCGRHGPYADNASRSICLA